VLEQPRRDELAMLEGVIVDGDRATRTPSFLIAEWSAEHEAAQRAKEAAPAAADNDVTGVNC
jgi:hypothetical protein